MNYCEWITSTVWVSVNVLHSLYPMRVSGYWREAIKLIEIRFPLWSPATATSWFQTRARLHLVSGRRRISAVWDNSSPYKNKEPHLLLAEEATRLTADREKNAARHIDCPTSQRPSSFLIWEVFRLWFSGVSGLVLVVALGPLVAINSCGEQIAPLSFEGSLTPTWIWCYKL